MQIFLNIVYLIVGLALLIFGADFFVSGASALAKKMKIPSMIIGLTIVAIGTSMPELVVSVISAIKGNADISIGNVLGSNIMNIVLILGVVGTIGSIAISTVVLTDLLILTCLTFVFLIMCYTQKQFSRWEGTIALVLYLSYIAFAIVRNYAF